MGQKKEKTRFSGQLGFVMAAAGSAVGVGNLWRFPYLAAKDGGGLFLIIYLVLVLTFGFALLTSDIAIGRRTRKSAVHAYSEMNRKWKFLGILTFIVPLIIMTYYAVIGGWVTKYAVVYLTGQASAAAQDGYFSGFLASPGSSVFFALLFMAVTALIVYKGVENGIEKVSKWMMPVLLLMIVIIAVFALTLKKEGADGVVRTGLQGFLFYLKPDLTGMTVSRFLSILLDAMSQIFFSLSVSMGIMITYGSYVKSDVDLGRSVTQIEFFDTAVAFLAGMMIIPSIYVFSGVEGMNAGTGLMFISLPKVFADMGPAGNIVGLLFFVTAVFATLTSCISVLEAIVSNCMEIFHVSRKKVTITASVLYLAASAIIALGYSVFYLEIPLPNGSTGQLLDLMDYLSNSFMMPFISMLSCILIGWIIGPKYITDEVQRNGEKFTRKKLYIITIRYIAPIVMAVLFLQSAGVWDLLFH